MLHSGAQKATHLLIAELLQTRKDALPQLMRAACKPGAVDDANDRVRFALKELV